MTEQAATQLLTDDVVWALSGSLCLAYTLLPAAFYPFLLRSFSIVSLKFCGPVAEIIPSCFVEAAEVSGFLWRVACSDCRIFRHVSTHRLWHALPEGHAVRERRMTAPPLGMGPLSGSVAAQTGL